MENPGRGSRRKDNCPKFNRPVQRLLQPGLEAAAIAFGAEIGRNDPRRQSQQEDYGDDIPKVSAAT